MAISQIALAKQVSAAKNARVRWQIVEIPDSRSGDAPAFRLIRLQFFDPSQRSWRTLGRQQILPVAVVADPAQSTLLTTLDTNVVGTVSDLNYGGQSNAVAEAATVVFFSDGRTGLSPNSIWSLTFHDKKRTNDFLTVQVDPVSGSTRVFRP